jgi:hypothetical protein
MANEIQDSKREEKQSIAKTINQSLGTLYDLVEKYSSAAKEDGEHSITKTPSDSQHPSEHKYL